MSGLAIDRRRICVLSLAVFLCTSLLVPVAFAAETRSLTSETAASDRPDRGSIDDAVAAERSVPARIDPALEGADGVVEAIVRLEHAESTAAASATAADPATLQAATNRSQRPLERAAATTSGLDVERQFWLANAALVRIDTDRVALETVATIDGVVEIHPDAAVQLAATETGAATGSSGSTSGPTIASTEPPSSPVAPTGNGSATTTEFGDSYTYGLEQLSVPTALEQYGARGDGATVAVLDTGADDTHPDVDVDAWRDFSGGSSTPMDYNGHGTHVAGTIAGGGASGTQIGVAPEAELLVGAVLTDCDSDGCVGRTSDVIDGMQWAVDNGADVISLSLGSEGYTSTYISAVRQAEESGTVVVAGAGNSGDGVSISPGNVYDVISVGATDRFERVTEFSSGEVIDTADAWGWQARSHWPDSYVVPTVTAPGDRIRSAASGGGYVRKSGTSMATPHVAGVVALLQGATDRRLEPDEIRAALTTTAAKPAGEPDEPDTRYGHGIVDAAAALEEAGTFATVEGRVTDAVTDNPIADATVTLEGEEGTVAETTTGYDGRYAFEGLTGDREYALAVTADGYEEANESSFVPADETTTLDVPLAGEGAIEVAVEDAQFGDGVADATVAATAWHGTYPLTHAGDGVYVAENVPSRAEYALTATADGYDDGAGHVSVTEAERVTERIDLTGDARLELTAADAVTGSAVANADVTIERAGGATYDVAEPTADDGTLSIPIAGTGEKYTVRADAEGYETDATTATVSSGGTVAVDLPLEGDGRLEVAVEDAQFGDGVPDATVEATGPQGTYSGRHEGDGTYGIGTLPGGAEYEVTVTGAGYAGETISAAVSSTGPTAERVRLEGNATLSVTAVDEDGDPIADAGVTVERPDETSFEAPGETSSDGDLEVTVPGTGVEYTVTADADGYAPAAATTSPVSSEATESVTVTLSPSFGVPGFGVAVAVTALVATLAAGVARRRP